MFRSYFRLNHWGVTITSLYLHNYIIFSQGKKKGAPLTRKMCRFYMIVPHPFWIWNDKPCARFHKHLKLTWAKSIQITRREGSMIDGSQRREGEAEDSTVWTYSTLAKSEDNSFSSWVWSWPIWSNREAGGTVTCLSSNSVLCKMATISHALPPSSNWC